MQQCVCLLQQPIFPLLSFLIPSPSLHSSVSRSDSELDGKLFSHVGTGFTIVEELKKPTSSASSGPLQRALRTRLRRHELQTINRLNHSSRIVKPTQVPISSIPR